MNIGAALLAELALDGSFADASSRYSDNDAGRLAAPPDAATPDEAHSRDVMLAITGLLVASLG